MEVITGIDLPADSPGGSVELLRDLYLGAPPRIPSAAFMLQPANAAFAAGENGPVILPVHGKALDGKAFWSYVARLSAAIRARFPAECYDVVHLQHLAFGATAALQRAYPGLPQVAIVHGTDLLFAEAHPTQADVLRRAVATARAVVVPTWAMADRLTRLTDVRPGQVVHIPWGIADELFDREANPIPELRDKLRILYAGRLTAEKTTAGILTAIAGLDGVELAVAAPVQEFARLAQSSDLTTIRYLGWHARRELWREFTRHDLLIVPSLALEAFGLVAVEAQACGLPVAFHAVPGLSEVLADSAFRVDFSDIGQVKALVKRLQGHPELLREARESGQVNSSRFPLTATTAALTELSASLQ